MWEKRLRLAIETTLLGTIDGWGARKQNRQVKTRRREDTKRDHAIKKRTNEMNNHSKKLGARREGEERRREGGTQRMRQNMQRAEARKGEGEKDCH